MELLDQALAGQSAEVKARVQNILLRYDIDVENEFFLIFTAIGHLLAIVEESPENWRALFDEFERELDGWAQQNLRTLEAIHQQGEAAERMSQCFLRLTDSLKVSSSKTTGLQTTLTELSRTFGRLNTKLDRMQGESKTVLSSTQALSSKFETTESELEDMAARLDWTWSVNVGMTIAVTSLSLLFGFTLWRQQAVIDEQTVRLGWLLDKANREECVQGIKPADDPQCQQYF